MKLLTKNTDYAIRALMTLGASDGSFVSAKVVSQEQGIPYEYLRKILQTLIKEKIIESKEGGQGGFRIKRKPEQIKIADVIKIFQGNIQISECLFQKEICPNRSTCVLRENILEVEKIVAKKFSDLTLKKLLKQTLMKGSVK